jgi:2-polyprenyl-6-methoxyphenol hydroxylase-like FAD-dependent oxidoreductase
MGNILKTDVLIVGAGPTGLSLAVQLIRYGIDFLLIDKKEGPTDLSKAIVVHARTMEIFDQVGLAQKAIAHGSPVQKGALLHNGDVSAHLDFTDIGGQLSPFPFLLIHEQSKTERLLYNYLQQNGKDVHWQTDLQNFTQDENGVTAILKTADNETQTVAARYVVGCDGASSPTRHLAGLGFEGSTIPRLFYVADVDMEFEAEKLSFYGTFGEHAFVLMFPLAGDKHWRLIGNLPEYDPNADVEVTYDRVEEKVKALVKRPLDIVNVRWFSTYKVHTRHAEQFSVGRCFLAGDAAHIHTPAGGQGMNTGIQDAYNLAWKLSFVLKGYAQPSLLNTYNEERLANAKNLLKSTDQFFEIATADNWYVRFFRDSLLPGLAGLATQFKATREALFPTVSMIGINYHESSLSRAFGNHLFSVKAGDRMPYFLIDGIGIYDKLKAPKLHLLIFSDGQQTYQNSLQTILDQHGDLLDGHVISLYPKVADVFGTKQSFTVLLRPDNYIGFISPGFAQESLSNYLTRFIQQLTNAPIS